MSQKNYSPHQKFIHKWFFTTYIYLAHIKHFISFLHLLVAEHVAIYFQPIAQAARTAHTKTFYLRAQQSPFSNIAFERFLLDEFDFVEKMQ